MNSTLPMRLTAGWLLACGLAACNGDSGGAGAPFDPADLLITGALNDTGVQSCAGEEEPQLACPQAGFPEQDGQHGRDALALNGRLSKQGAGIAGFDWTKLDSSGNRLTVQDAAWDAEGTEQNGTRWSCVQDHVTGLTWEVKESSPDHPRYAGHSYSWYLEDTEMNGGVEGGRDGGTCSTSPCDTRGYVAWLNSEGLCGHADWRMPTVAELASIAVIRNVLPAMDTDFFPNVPQPRFFTAQSSARDANLAWYVYFSDGSVSFTNKTDPSHVRLVRGEQW